MEYPLMVQRPGLGLVHVTSAPRDVMPDTLTSVGIPGTAGTTVAFSEDMYVTEPLLFVTVTE